MTTSSKESILVTPGPQLVPFLVLRKSAQTEYAPVRSNLLLAKFPHFGAHYIVEEKASDQYRNPHELNISGTF